jgi:acyl-CoA-binding protein
MKFITLLPLVCLSLPNIPLDGNSASGLVEDRIEPAAPHILHAMKQTIMSADSISEINKLKEHVNFPKENKPIATDWNMDLKTYLEIIDLQYFLSGYLENRMINTVQINDIVSYLLQARLGDCVYSSPVSYENVFTYQLWSAWKGKFGMSKREARQHYISSLNYLKSKLI